MTKTNSTSLILNGRVVADEVLKRVRNEILELKNQNKRTPGLSVILVGDNPASHTYVKNKEKTCHELGIYSEVHRLPTDISDSEVFNLIDSLNNNQNIDGILVQLPLPIHLKSDKLINHLNPDKDVDGLHPSNLGKLLSGQDCLKPCTPLGVIEILKHYSINLAGMNSVIIGRSTLVGKPLSLLLLKANSTVTIVHSKTANIEEVSRTADILICAAGKAKLVKSHWVKPSAIVIDVGINKIHENNNSKLVGDVDFESVSQVCQAITPVPGGVGPVTIAMLMANTLTAYKARNENII